jgi:hypothetical protein
MFSIFFCSKTFVHAIGIRTGRISWYDEDAMAAHTPNGHGIGSGYDKTPPQHMDTVQYVKVRCVFAIALDERGQLSGRPHQNVKQDTLNIPLQKWSAPMEHF